MKDYLKMQKRYKVSDLLNNETKIVFILESPHKDEIKYGVPVAGRAGGTMTKTLFGNDMPLGRFLKSSWDENQQLRYGVMNVCNIPMQRTAYGTDGEDKRLEEFFNTIEKVRTSNSKRPYKDKNMNDIDQQVKKDFELRLERLRGNQLLLIPCGKFAEKYLRDVEVSSRWEVIWGIPHPSYNSWSREKYQPIIDNMCSKIKLFV